jgi:RNA polymerase sigma-70 factor (ECF subfamily)
MSRSYDKDAFLTDKQIIDLYWQRDESAIEETDKKYGRMLFRIAYNLLSDRMDCEECKNDTYVRVWNSVPPTRPRVLPAYLTEIMRRVAINKYKQKTSQRRVPSELTVSMDELRDSLQNEASFVSERDAEEIGKVINAFLRELPERRRYIFIERFYFAEPVEEIATELSVSVATVYREIERIKKDLKVYLERNDIYI